MIRWLWSFLYLLHPKTHELFRLIVAQFIAFRATQPKPRLLTEPLLRGQTSLIFPLCVGKVQNRSAAHHTKDSDPYLVVWHNRILISPSEKLSRVHAQSKLRAPGVVFAVSPAKRQSLFLGAIEP
jgi:hypothetical protein